MSITHPSFGTLADDRIIIFDTTLRDGEQSPGFSMNIQEKIRMAEALTDLGIDVMEAGFPIASPGDYESVKAIAEFVGQRDDSPVICGLARSGREDITARRRCGADGETKAHPQLHLHQRVAHEIQAADGAGRSAAGGQRQRDPGPQLYR